MKNNYKIYKCKQNIGALISHLHKEEMLAIGIMDTGTEEDLLSTLDFFNKNFNHDIHVISQSDRCQAEMLQNEYPDVTFIIFSKAPSLAERINALASICVTSYFLVIRSDCDLVSFEWTTLKNRMLREKHPSVLCPLMFNKSKELVPTIRTPNIHDGEIEPLSFSPGYNDTDNLYPFLGVGFYDRALFQRLRGYDEEINGTYWQTMDFGTKSWLYGYPIVTVNDMALYFRDKQFLIEDISELSGIDRFYTKALSVHKKNGRLFLKRTPKFNKSVLNSDVRPRITLYRTDYQSLCDSWVIPK